MRRIPGSIISIADFNAAWGAWASPGRALDSACYRTIIPPAFLPAMSGTALYFWFLLSNTSFPCRHDTIGTAEDLGVFFGSLWILC